MCYIDLQKIVKQSWASFVTTYHAMTSEDIDPSLEATVLSCGSMGFSVRNLGIISANAMECASELNASETSSNLQMIFHQVTEDIKWFGTLYASQDPAIQDQLHFHLLSTELIPQGEKAEMQAQAMRALVTWTEECGQYS